MEDEEFLTPRQKRFLEENPETSLSRSDGAKPEIQGVSGWLGFLVAALLGLGPVLTLITTYLEISEAETLYPWVRGTSLWEDMQAITWISAVVFCLVSVYAGLRLLKKHVPSSVGIAIACLWIAGPTLAIATLAAMNQAGINSSATDIGASVARPFIWALIWTLYLVFSRRVRNTYFAGKGVGQAIGSSWRSNSKRTRQLTFLCGCWLVLSFLWLNVMEPYGPYLSDEEFRRGWAIVLLPPFLILFGGWAYKKIVGVDD